MRCTEHTAPKEVRRPIIGCVLASLIMAALPGASAEIPDNWPTMVEVFTTSDQALGSASVIELQRPYQDSELQIYRLDGIQKVEGELSENLPEDPESAKRAARQHIQQLDQRTMTAVQNAAVGLAKAVQYGVTRYPAVVFDGKAVVYGLTDLGAALDHYRAWRARTR